MAARSWGASAGTSGWEPGGGAASHALWPCPWPTPGRLTGSGLGTPGCQEQGRLGGLCPFPLGPGRSCLLAFRPGSRVGLSTRVLTLQTHVADSRRRLTAKPPEQQNEGPGDDRPGLCPVTDGALTGGRGSSFLPFLPPRRAQHRVTSSKQSSPRPHGTGAPWCRPPQPEL